jgi:uncharacterized membrane protein
VYLRAREALPDSRLFTSPGIKWFLAAGVANTLFLLVYYAALSVAPVALVVPITQTSLLFVVGLSAVFLQRLERVTPRLVVASVLVAAGAALVVVSE